MDDLGIGFASPSSYTPRKFESMQWDDFEMDDFAEHPAAEMEVDTLADTMTEAGQMADLDNKYQALAVALPLRRSRPLPATEWKQHRDEIVKLYIHEERELEEVRQLMVQQRGFNAT
jgi:hypothetical protein